MIILNRPHTDPFFNLAAEEYLVKNTEEPLFMLWQNTPSVVIGKHQNALKEINLKYLKAHKIPIIRRISGGGTVYHDLGNLNYSFIDFGSRESLVNFKKYSQPIIDVLHQLGVNVKLEGKSDLKIEEKKISGNASHVYKNRVLHHGTLLFSSALNTLENSIQGKIAAYNDRAVQSNRSAVTNIQTHLKKVISLNEFKQSIIDFVLTRYTDVEIRDFSSMEINEIQVLANEKYKSWAWNFGYSPRYQYNGLLESSMGAFPFALNVKHGIIETVDIRIEMNDELKQFQKMLIGIMHQEEAIIELYEANNQVMEALGVNRKGIIKAILG